MATEGVPFWVQAATALAAVVGPIVALCVSSKNTAAILKISRRQANSALEAAQRQVHASVVSANRQKWIDALREDIASFLTEADVIRARISPGTGVSALQIQDAGRAMTLLFNRVRLRLNPLEEDHQALVALMSSILSKIDHTDAAIREQDMAALSQKILKQEWIRVKVGD